MATSNAAFKALADPARREILRLVGRREMTAGEIAQHFGFTKPTLSHHLATLKDADLVTSRRAGQTIWYAINTTVLEDVITWAMDLASGLGKRRKR